MIKRLKLLWNLRKLEKAWNAALFRRGKMGWKTIAGAVILAAGGALRFLDESGVVVGGAAIAESLMAIGAALGLFGVRHAIAKSSK